MINLHVKIPEELYNSLKAFGCQNYDIEREFLDDVVLQLYARHIISIGKAASIFGISIQSFREVLLKRNLPMEYFTKDVYEEDMRTIESMDKGKA